MLSPSVFRFETDEGEFRSEQGRVKHGPEGENINEITGEYSWISPEGQLVSFTYKGVLYKSFVRKMGLVKYQSQSAVI